jgi:hypothetical protein
VSGWNDEARDKGYERLPNLYEKVFDTKSLSVGKELSKAALSESSELLEKSTYDLDQLSPAGKVEAACTAVRLTDETRAKVKDMVNLPKLDIITKSLNDSAPTLSSLHVVGKDNKVIFEHQYETPWSKLSF